MSDAELEEVLRVNLYGAVACIRAVAPTMIANRSGAIVNIGAFTGKQPRPNRLVYAISKMALLGMSRMFALELAPHQVRCNVVSPGPVEGERLDEVIGRSSKANNITEDQVTDMLRSWSPMNVIATEEDVCAAIHYLTGKNGERITGQDMNVDGGIIMF